MYKPPLNQIPIPTLRNRGLTPYLSGTDLNDSRNVYEVGN